MDLYTRNFIADVVYFSILFLGVFAFFLILKVLIEAWVGYKNKEWFLSRDYVLLEILIPKEITKSPLAMELFFTAIHENSRDGNWYETLTQGKTRPVFSYEMASIGGKVHLFVRCEKTYKPRVEAHLYAHYSEIEIIEVPDYARMVDYSDQTHNMFIGELKLTKEDPIPIKTYKVFGLEKTGVDEEEKIDPISQTLEVLASVGEGEQMWAQIVVRGHKEDNEARASLSERVSAFLGFLKNITYGFNSGDAVKNIKIFIYGKKLIDWKEEGKELIKKYKKEQVLGGADEDGKNNTVTTLSPEEKNMLTALEENLTKPAFDVGIRVIYLAESDSFKPGERIGAMLGLFKQYSSNNYNGFKPGLVSDYDYPWQDRKGKIKEKIRVEALRDYRRREYFFSEKKYAHGKNGYPTFVLSVEEMATIFHLPGSVVQTPTFDRIDSSTSQAPSNLPL